MDEPAANAESEAGAAPQQVGGAERRQFHRVENCDAIGCNLGTILDLSSGGLRLLCKAKPDDVTRVELTSGDDSVVLPARVVWCHKVGMRKYVMGLEFGDLDAEQTLLLMDIATAA